MRLIVVKRLLVGSAAAQDAALADYLAGRPAESFREVQASVQRVLNAAAAQRVVPSPALAREVLDVLPPVTLRAGRSRPGNSSGIQAPGLGLVKSREKTVTEWPTVADRLLAELR
jgi:hypothetical protein